MIPLLVLRPEPGNGVTVARARALGLEPVSCPLFAVEAVAWTAPDPDRFDYLLLTSANAVRWGGNQLSRLAHLPALAVGPATAAAAAEAGFHVVRSGNKGVEALLDPLPASARLLHLAGADHHCAPAGHSVETRIVYRAAALASALPPGKYTALVHSARAGRRLAELARDRSTIVIAAISAAAAAACGAGWSGVEVAEHPDDVGLLALAARLCQD